jgi:hypothetical protein
MYPGNGIMADLALQQVGVGRAGILRNFRIHVEDPAAAGAQTITYTVMVGGVATAITATLVVTGTDVADNANSVAVASGDLVGIRMTKSAAHQPVGEIYAYLDIAG